jgi:hypothetical protein
LSRELVSFGERIFMVSRVISSVGGMAVSLVLERYLGYSYWFSISAGIAAFLIIQYGFHFVRVRRDMDGIYEKARRNHPFE